MTGQRIFSCLSLAFALFFAGTVLGIEVQLTAGKDNALYEDDNGNFSNGAGIYLFAGQTGSNGSEERRPAVVAFDLSSIPAGSVINSVTLRLTINRVPSGAGDNAAAEDTTWIHTSFNTSFWGQAGGDYVSPATSIAPFDGYSGSTDVEESLFFSSSAPLIADVQSWVDNSVSNYGWILIADENTPKNARRLYSRESIGDHPDLVPTLTVDYTPVSVTEQLELTMIASGLSQPIGIVNAGDGSGRLFIIEQAGRIRIFETANQQLLAAPFLDITAAVDNLGNEQGLLGLAFHPQYGSNRKFYVSYTRDPGPESDRSVIAMYKASVANPNIAISTETVLMEFDQDAINHNGGDLHFGADGYLYFGSGDGGGSDDQYNHAQDLNSLKGKLLRIDVDGPPSGSAGLCGQVSNYAIPPENPFTGIADGCDEILFFGLRNPWRFSFDALTEELYIGDVGQHTYEEIDLAQVGDSGTNFGWSCREGAHDFLLGNDCISAYTDPIMEYPHAGGACSVTGGYVYRGGGAALEGRYIYGDYCSAQIWIATPQGAGWSIEEWPDSASTLNTLASFGQDEQCELYIADRSDGKIYRIDDSERVHNSGFEHRRCR